MFSADTTTTGLITQYMLATIENIGGENVTSAVGWIHGCRTTDTGDWMHCGHLWSVKINNFQGSLD